ncbi:MAG: ABC transporter permease [Bacteroidota bacterium]|nr:ABC transporter permease [Bacteroidota bacterium]
MRRLIFIRVIRESLVFAIDALRVNVVRTILSLLGITIGIFCVISVFTVFDSIERNFKKSLAEVGSNVLFIQKWPWQMGGDYAWWKYMKRPQPKLDELTEIKNRSNASDVSAYYIAVNKSVQYADNSVSGAIIVAVSQDYYRLTVFDIEHGRYFSQQESQMGRNVAIIGYDIAQNLFGQNDPIGHDVKIAGLKVEVIGVFKKVGDNMFGNSTDNQVLVPALYGRNFINFDGDVESCLMVKAKPGVTNTELSDELRGIMRSIRKLKPQAEDNFAINETSIISKGFDSIFAVISMVGWVIGGFSLLVGGFGIANIMFVSVKERTTIIGIKKSMGAKRSVILLEFLFESIFLSVMGGIIGLFIIFIGTLVASHAFSMPLVLTQKNIILGISISSIIGLVSGFIPAWNASRLDPVEAMRSTF